MIILNSPSAFAPDWLVEAYWLHPWLIVLVFYLLMALLGRPPSHDRAGERELRWYWGKRD